MANKKETTSTKKKNKKVEVSDTKEKDKKTEKKISKNETTSLSVINTEELNHLIEEDLEGPKKIQKNHTHIGTHILLVVSLLVSLIYFGILIFNPNTSVGTIITSLLLTIFVILYVVVSITYNRGSKSLILVSCFLLLGFFGTEIYQVLSNYTSLSGMPDFSGKSITEVMKWSRENKIAVTQEYEFSDMIDEYSVISQSISAGTSLKDVDEVIISISEGPNPSKEIVVPNMIGWDTERVIQFVKENYLSNVVVEFVESDKAKDTVIEQNASGSFKRDDELKLTFSYGEELGYEEVSLPDFTNKSKFEVEFFMKQHQLNYSFDEDYSASIKKGYAIKQSIEKGESVKIHDTEVVVTISKGPEIKVPDLTKYTIEKVTEWAIENRVKISFSNRYDDSVSENGIIEANYKEGDIIEQGTVVKIVLSRGKLSMPKFSSLDDFYEWTGKYEIPYEEIHEFSDNVPVGDVIRYSYKTGEAIKNGDSITVVISDGVKKSVPNVVGLSKKEAITKLDNANLKYNFIYRNNSQSKDTVLSQSIRSGSEVSEGTTITITLSNGVKETNNNNNNNSGGSSTTPTPSPTVDEKPSCSDVTLYIEHSYLKTNPQETCSTIKGVYPQLHFNCSYTCGPTNGLVLNGGSLDGETFSTCDTITLTIADSNKC